MQITSITPFSLIDFPEKVSCVVFTSGCNLRCKFCHNSEFVLPELIKKVSKNFIPEKIFFNFLEKRKWLLDGVSICGWEPTLQKWLVEFCIYIKQLGYLVKLDTNGSNPQVLSKLLQEKVVDYIAMDVKHTFSWYAWLVGEVHSIDAYKESIEIIMKSGIDYEFRTTCIQGVHSPQAIEEMAQYIKGARKYVLQNYVGKNTLDPSFAGTPFHISDLQNFKEIVKRYVEIVDIRI